MPAAKYRKKPVVIEAIQWYSWSDENYVTGGNNYEEVAAFIGDSFDGIMDFGRAIAVSTLEGTMRGYINDYFIKGVKGEFYPCKPDIFEATYEKVEPENYGGVVSATVIGENNDS